MQNFISNGLVYLAQGEINLFPELPSGSWNLLNIFGLPFSNVSFVFFWLFKIYFHHLNSCTIFIRWNCAIGQLSLSVRIWEFPPWFWRLWPDVFRMHRCLLAPSLSQETLNHGVWDPSSVSSTWALGLRGLVTGQVLISGLLREWLQESFRWIRYSPKIPLRVSNHLTTYSVQAHPNMSDTTEIKQNT